MKKHNLPNNNHSDMRRNNINIIGVARRCAVACLLLFAIAGNAQAQDKPFVIKKTNYANVGGEHYLAHVLQDGHYVLQDATTFSPDCFWYSGRETNLSGTNHNYYFIDDAGQYRFLSAPLEHGGALTLSESKPPVYLLNNTDHNYYFYDWDYDNYPDGAGVARGHQHNGILTEYDCTYSWGDGQCWEVYWVECVGSQWKLSTEYTYVITENSGRFHRVTDTPFAMQITSPTNGGLASLDDITLESGQSASPFASITPFSYIPAYHKYDFDEVTDTLATPHTVLHHTYYYPYGSDNEHQPTTSISSPSDVTYNWSLSGEGADYLTLTGEHTATPTLTYSTPNNDGHKTAILTLTVIYQDGSSSSQTTSCSVLVKTPCQNPVFSANVTYDGVIVSWTHTADSYTVQWQKQGESEWTSASTSDVTYTITGLEYGTTYDYQVIANCQSSGQSQSFTTLAEPKALVYGAVFGGGRMANVGGKTEVVIINTDSIVAVYGGNDIAGSVLDTVSTNPQDKASATIILGIDAEANSGSYSQLYNNGNASTKVRIGDVYGGGNGYYAYSDYGREFVQASNDYDTVIVFPTDSVSYMTRFNTVGTSAFTNTGSDNDTLAIPRLVNTSIIVTNDAVKVDSIFGGAKNAFITNDDDDANGTSITVNGGIAYAVFGGNNFGGLQNAGKHHVEIVRTKTSNSYDGIGRTFGIAYVFGGGNKVRGAISDVIISGGMCDTVFGGGNMEDVSKANVLVDCASIISHANDEGYQWNGTSLYNVRTLFGGNNQAPMSGLPTLTLTKGGIGTVYGGGNAGDMLANVPDDAPNSNPGTGPIATNFGSNYIGSDPLPIYYGTHVVLESNNVFVDYLYGGCQMSNVKYSTWVEIMGGHVGIVYGGCNISGDVGSTRLFTEGNLTNEQKQATQGATYVHASGGTIVSNLFAGSNGYYHCNDGLHYIEGLDFTPGYNFVGMEIPTHNETHVKVSDNVLVKGNVYAGGNLACVGFINETIGENSYPTFRGFASILMTGGTVRGNVYGGGNRASIFGSNEVKVSGGSIGYDEEGHVSDGALYGGNDRAGQVAQITNRVYPSSNNYDVASDMQTNLRLMGVKTYVSISGKPKIWTVYGGGNGDYPYTPEEYCDVTDQPVQSNTFVDVHVDAEGGANTGGYINTVYGGGNGVTVLDRITVFVNVQNLITGEGAYSQVGTIFGGNNKGALDILSDIIVLRGQVDTIYGGCNLGQMTGSVRYNDSTNLSSMVHLRSLYRPNGIGEPVVTTPKVTDHIFGGCRSAGVTNNTLVIVEGGLNTAKVFGGCNVSGTVGGDSQVIVSSDDYDVTTGNVYGGGLGAGTAITGKGMIRVCGTKTTVNGDVFGGGDLGVVNGGTDILIGLRPTVATSNVSGITEATATCGGNVTGLGSTDLLECGICWGRTPDPIVGDNHVAADEPGLGAFTELQMTGLEGGKEYYVRAYARNSIGTSYGENVKFETPEP